MKTAYNVQTFAIDINLIHRRETQRTAPVVPAMLIVLCMGAALAVGWLWYDARNELNTAQTQIAQISQSVQTLENGIKQKSYNGQLAELLQQPERIQQLKPATTLLLERLSKLLPQYANVAQLNVSDTDRLSATIYFATTEDVITFTQSIQASEHFKLLKMGTINNITYQPPLASDSAPPSNTSNANPASEQHDKVITLPIYQSEFELQYNWQPKGGA